MVLGRREEMQGCSNMLNFGEYCKSAFAELGVTLGVTTPTTGVFDDLGLDSLQAFELILVTEELALGDRGATFYPQEVPAIFTMGDAYDYYCSVASGRMLRRLAIESQNDEQSSV